MSNIFIFLSFLFFLTLLMGKVVEKIKVPWIFASLLLGAVLAFYNPFYQVTSSSIFNFLAQLGMYFLLFIIGLELNLKEIKKKSLFILKAAFFIIFLEAFFGMALIHFVFGYNWLISLVVSLSFATVGEAVLLPILEKFKLLHSDLGQMIIGIGTFDDIIEVIVLVVVVILVGMKNRMDLNIWLILGSLVALFILTGVCLKFKKIEQKFITPNVESLFLLVLFILFLFLGIGYFAEATALAALLAGIAVKNFIPPKKFAFIESEIKALCYGFFAPIFFFSVGLSMDMHYLIKYPLLVLLVVVVSKGAKLLGSYIVGRKELGLKQSILLGIGLSIRFSTGIVIIKVLFESGIIGANLYSVIIASSIAFKFIVPVLFSNLLVKWKLAYN